MSEEKLYAIKNDDCEWADAKHIFGYGAWATPYKAQHEEYAKCHGGHVVTLIEEPEKVVLTKGQAEIVEHAHTLSCPAFYISAVSGKDEELIMKAYVNGYTVAQEKKYNVKVPHTDDSYFYKVDDEYCNAGDSYYLKGITDKKWFTDSEIEHYRLGDCERIGVTDDEQ